MKTVALLLACLSAAFAIRGPHAENGWVLTSRSDPSSDVSFSVAMPISNKDKLDKLFWDVSTPGSAHYGKFWSMEALNALTATDKEVAEEVAVWLKSSGAACKPQTQDSFACHAKAADIEKMLSTTMHKYTHSETGFTINAIEEEYSFPETMKGKIVFVTGLRHFPVARFSAHARPHTAGRTLKEGSGYDDDYRPSSGSSGGDDYSPSSGSSGGDDYSPSSGSSGGGDDDYKPSDDSNGDDDSNGGGGSNLSVVPETLTSIYSISVKGSSQVIQSAIEFQGLTAFTNSDLSTFISNTGEASFSIAKHIGPFQQNPPQAESTLDVQYLGSIGEGNTNYYWTSNNWMYDFTINVLSGSNPVPDVLSMSYGWSETEQCEIDPSSKPCQSGGSQAFVEAVNTNFQKIGAAGHTMLAASGDAGAHGRSDLSCASGQTHPGYPAASPYVTAVGATQLESNAASTGATEPICKSQLQCATSGSEMVSSTATGSLITSGGGFSAYAAQPSYQATVVTAYLAKSGVAPPDSDFNKAGRGYPDVAALGHNYYIELDGQVSDVDGTSCACPVFAGVLGLLNAYRVENGQSKLGFANPFLYQLYASSPTAFNDITEGNNKCTQEGGSCCSTGFSATTGWDATTGLGTPNVANMIKAMASMEHLAAPSTDLAQSLRGSHYDF